MNSRTAVLDKIVEFIYENTGKEITGNILQGVLTFMADRQYQPSEIPVEVEGIEATNLQDALIELLGTGALSIAEIVTAIEALTGEDRLDYDALKNTPTIPVVPSDNADFVAFAGTTQHESDDPFIIEVGDTVQFESRLSLLNPFSKIAWDVICINPATFLSANNRDAEFTFDVAGIYQVAVSVSNLAGDTVASKTALGYIDVQDTSLFYVEFLAKDYNTTPLSGVLISFDGVEKYTTDSGKAKFVNIASGSYELEATKDGFTNFNNAAFAVAANIDESQLNMALNAYIENEQLIGTALPGETITALYDFKPAGYEGATEIKWWVENSEGTVIVPSVTKTRGIDYDYLMFDIPESAAGHILKAEIKAYDVQSNTNANMLKTPFMMVAEPSLPVYMGYRTSAQTAVITEGIVLGTTDPSQHSEIDQAANHADFPDKIDIHWKDVFTALDEFSEYTQWMAISEATLASEYAYYQNIDYLPSLGAYNTKGVIESLTVDGNAYKVYKLNPTAPLNYRLSTTGL